MREILVGGEPRAFAVMEGGRLCEYIPEDGDAAAKTVLLGRVVRAAKGMGAAFVDIGEERSGFLPLDEKSDSFTGNQPLREGDRVCVQVVREAHGEKGAFLTRDVSLSGEYVILMPCNRFVGVSAKLNGEPARRLKQMGGEIAAGRFGLVMRTAASGASADAVRSEAEDLFVRWEEIAARAVSAPAPSVLWRECSALASLLDDYLPRGIDCVISDDEGIAQLVGGRCAFRRVQADPLRTAGVPEKLKEALQRRVWLKSGANLIIDECEALTVIDVNTAKSAARHQMEKNLTRVNTEACREIARQIRLRSLGGIIIIDMIDMTAKEDRDSVLAALKEAFAADRSKTVIHGYTSLGLIEMTRRRTRKSLRETLGPKPGRTPRPEEETHG